MKLKPIAFDIQRWIHLSDQQADVLRWVLTGKGSLELLARAGCGKTYTLMEIVDAIIEFSMGDIALMAFNKSIAGEIKVRLEKKGYDWRQALAGTVHSFGIKVWRKLAPNVVVDEKKLDNIINELKLEKNSEVYIECGDTIAKLCSLAKQRALGHLASMDELSSWTDIWDHFDLENDVSDNWQALDVCRAAVKVYKISLKRCREVIDFDDMILAPLYFKAKFWPRDWVLLDESQDTNPARRALALAMLKPKTGRMVFVGDNHQAIYGFTGADSDSMNQLKVATNATTLPLNVTRRCPKKVVELAQRLVPDFKAHESAPEGIVRAIGYDGLCTEKLGKDDVILCRNTAPLISTAYALLSKGIACRVEGREIGQGLIKLARRWKIKTLDKLLDKLDDYQQRQTAKFMSKDQEDRIQGLEDQCECLRVVIARCQSQQKYTIDELEEDIKSMFGNTPEGEKPKCLTLSTVHKSKGREWVRVYLMGRAKFMPSPYAKKPWQLTQETNLEYVAYSRAIHELIEVPAPE